MWKITTWLEEEIFNSNSGEIVKFIVPNPDDRDNNDFDSFPGIDTKPRNYHSWKAWSDLAELLYCRMLTPKLLDGGEVLLRYQKLDLSDSFHQIQDEDKKEKYGAKSKFSAIQKNEEPAFLFAFRRALQQVKIAKRSVILDLGINSGDEFEMIQKLVKSDRWHQMQLIGIDHSPSAIKEAKARFPDESVTLHCHDINHLDELTLPKADLLLSIGTLQSPGIDFKPLFMSLIQNHLAENGAVILGFPNCRWIDGEMIYGAKAPNYNFPEMSLVIKDIYFCKKYLQQHKFRVTITGKDYLFLTATRIGMR
jgi:cyclopropane fatty-acyl-phospholipid synthase-like methyltransferase